MTQDSTKTEQITKSLTSLLNDCLETANQEHSFKVIETNLETEKFIVAFDIVEIDGEYMFRGY